MSDAERKARLVAAKILEKSGVTRYLDSQVYQDLVEMTMLALKKQEQRAA